MNDVECLAKHGDGGVVGHVLAPVGERSYVMGLGFDPQFSRQVSTASILGGVAGRCQVLLERDQQTAAAVRPQRVADVVLPERVLGLGWVRRGVVGRRVDPFHETDADDEAAHVVEERLTGLRVEQRERLAS